MPVLVMTVSSSGIGDVVSPHFTAFKKFHLQNRHGWEKGRPPSRQEEAREQHVWGKHCRHCFPGCQKSSFCLQLMPEGNMQQQKGGLSLTLSFLDVKKQIFMWCLWL